MRLKNGYQKYRPAYVAYMLCLGIISAFLFATCSKRSDEAALYNDSIVDHQDAIIQSFDVLDSTLADSSTSETLLNAAHYNLIHRIDNSILALDSIGPFRKDPSLMKAARSLFLSYNQLAEIHYSKLYQIKLLPVAKITEAIIDSTAVIHATIKQLSENAQNSFLQEQAAFGKKYHLKFE
jgi:hypothetical protein